MLIFHLKNWSVCLPSHLQMWLLNHQKLFKYSYRTIKKIHQFNIFTTLTRSIFHVLLAFYIHIDAYQYSIFALNHIFYYQTYIYSHMFTSTVICFTNDFDSVFLYIMLSIFTLMFSVLLERIIYHIS